MVKTDLLISNNTKKKIKDSIQNIIYVNFTLKLLTCKCYYLLCHTPVCKLPSFELFFQWEKKTFYCSLLLASVTFTFQKQKYFNMDIVKYNKTSSVKCVYVFREKRMISLQNNETVDLLYYCFHNIQVIYLNTWRQLEERPQFLHKYCIPYG